MKNILLITTVLIGINFSFGQQIKVLFLGNSFTYVYDVPGIFEQLAIEAGENVFVDSYADPGIALGTWTGAAGHNSLAGSLNKINSQDWDFVVVQDNLGIWVGNSPYQEAYDDLVENRNNILANNSCTEIVYFAGWCPVGGAQSGDSESACGSRVYNNLVNVNTNGSLNEIVSPVALSWNQSMSQYPSLDLYYSDDTHASINGAYLAASTLFVSILKKDPTQLSWYPTNWYDGTSMSASTATNMRQIALDVVMNATNYTQSNLENHTPTFINTSGVLSASGYSTYQWYIDGVLIYGATSSTHTALTSGIYTVTGYDADGCGNKSFELDITVSTANISDISSIKSELKAYPNPANNILNISAPEKIESIVLVSVTGKQVYSESNVLNVLKQIDLSDFDGGSYVLIVTTTETSYKKKVQIIK